MAGLLVNRTWFDGLASTELYESEFERLIAQESAVVFPGWRFVPFKVDVVSPLGRRRPDYALIDPRYRLWYVVEVEMAHHSLEGHVIPQIEVFTDGEYGAAHADCIVRSAPDLDRSSIEEMLRGTPPHVFVIVNLPMSEWKVPLARYGVQLGVVEIFRSDRNTYALRVNGFRPELPRSALTLCRRDPIVLKLFSVDAPAALPIRPGEEGIIAVDGRMTEWVRVDTASRVYLSPKRGDPVGDAKVVELQRADDGSLVFARKG